jgi:hypothetical protein
MALEFDITAAAPTLAEITAEREPAERERAILKYKNKRFLITFILVVLTLVSTALIGIIPAVNKPESSQDLAFVVSYFSPYLILPMFVIGNHLHIKRIEKPRKKVEAILAGLTEATGEELDEITASHAVIEQYRQQVTAQGRPLMKGEVDAMQRWLDQQTRAVG